MVFRPAEREFRLRGAGCDSSCSPTESSSSPRRGRQTPPRSGPTWQLAGQKLVLDSDQAPEGRRELEIISPRTTSWSSRSSARNAARPRIRYPPEVRRSARAVEEEPEAHPGRPTCRQASSATEPPLPAATGLQDPGQRGLEPIGDQGCLAYDEAGLRAARHVWARDEVGNGRAVLDRRVDRPPLLANDESLHLEDELAGLEVRNLAPIEAHRRGAARDLVSGSSAQPAKQSTAAATATDLTRRR